jgi:hypothetical protein
VEATHEYRSGERGFILFQEYDFEIRMAAISQSAPNNFRYFLLIEFALPPTWGETFGLLFASRFMFFLSIR